MGNFNVNDRTIVVLGLIILIAGIINIISRVLLMLAVGEDAKIIGVKNRTLWMLLTVFIPICSLLYLVLRNRLDKKVPRLCLNCGVTMPPNTRFCYNCTSTALVDYKLPDEKKHINLRTVFVICGVVAYVIAAVISNSAGEKISQLVKNNSNNNSGGYSDFFEEFGNEGGQGGSNGQNGSSDDDAFENFNNFGNDD